jgi:hypothetical protein
MSAVIALGALGGLAALIGFILGKSFSWPAIAAFSNGLAVLSAVMLQRQGFDAPSGIALGVALLSLSQAAFLGGESAPATKDTNLVRLRGGRSGAR